MQGESKGPAQLPQSLAEWDYATVERVVQLHEFEPGQFDYKAVLNPTREPGSEKLLESIRKTACSMANTDGGFILFVCRTKVLTFKHPLLALLAFRWGMTFEVISDGKLRTSNPISSSTHHPSRSSCLGATIERSLSCKFRRASGGLIWSLQPGSFTAKVLVERPSA